MFDNWLMVYGGLAGVATVLVLGRLAHIRRERWVESRDDRLAEAIIEELNHPDKEEICLLAEAKDLQRKLADTRAVLLEVGRIASCVEQASRELAALPGATAAEISGALSTTATALRALVAANAVGTYNRRPARHHPTNTVPPVAETDGAS
jgi:hypothetical protein